MDDFRDIDGVARAVLRDNDRGNYTIPSPRLYPYQWNWDSAFAALGFASFDIDRAWTEIETLLAGQWPSGMVPHIQFHCNDDSYFPGAEVWDCRGPVPSSGISQPPVAATVVRWIWEADRTEGKERLPALYHKLVAWHRWFMTWRSEEGAICVVHPWESGRDNAPDWDGAMASIDPVDVEPYLRRDTECVDPIMRPTKDEYDRYLWLVGLGRACNWDDRELNAQCPFRVADPAITFILLRANRDLTALGIEIGEDVEELRSWTRILEQGAGKLWNSELESYDSFDSRNRKWCGRVTSAAFLCWYAGVDDDRMLRQFERIARNANYIIPSQDPASEGFDRLRYWRGPVWPMMNMMIATGMRDAGHTSQAEELRRSTSSLLRNGGFAEYFDPFGGSPAGGRDFTWAAAVWLAWASREEGLDR